MKTMHPVVLHGCSIWNKELLPLDEFTVRLQLVQKKMKENNLAGLVIYGDVRNYAKVSYLSNYIPKHSYAILLIPAFGEMRLLAKLAGTRDIPYVQTLTWIEDIRPVKNLSKEINEFLNDISALKKDKSTVGIYGSEIMPFSIYNEIQRSSRDVRLLEMDDQLEDMLQKKRPREKYVIKEASHILNYCVEAIKEIHRREGSVVTAAIEAERVGRNLGAQDVRVLYSLDSGKTLQPLENISEIRNDPMIIYIAIEYLGYWTEGMVTLTEKTSILYNQTVTLLNYFKKSMKSGVTIESVIKGASKLIEPYQLHSVTEGNFGYNIGLSLQEKPLLNESFGDVLLEEGNIYSVHACLSNGNDENCLLSSIISIEKTENEIIWTSIKE